MKQTFCVVEYRHRHGTELSGFRTSVEADRGIAEICLREAPDECSANLAELEALFSAGRYLAVRAVYLEHVVQTEGFTVHQVTIDDDSIVNFTVVERGNEVVHAAQSFPSGRNPGGTWCGRLFFWTNSDVTFPVGTQNIKAFIPKEPRFLTCLSCIGAEPPPG